jgi:23S rRNA (guanosine2251-2'-O)-methyltransferase
MRPAYFEIRLCPNCGLRYPLTAGHPFGNRCPVCLGETQAVLKYEFKDPPLPIEGKSLSQNFAALLDNLRSAWNVGAIFRTADGLGITKLYLCGITSTPDQEAVAKTALGAEKSLAWEYSHNALEKARSLKEEGFQLIALEQDTRAVAIWESPISPGSEQGDKNLLIVGNEVTGVDPELLDLCDQIVYIPMKGKKSSFNVEVAFGIAVFQLMCR